MDKTGEMCVLKKEENKVPQMKRKLRAYDVLVRAVGFLLARSMVFSVLAPFGISYMAMERRFSKKSLISCLMVCVGYVSVLGSGVSVKYIFAALSYMAFLFVADCGDRDIPLYVAVSAVGAAIAFADLCCMIWIGFSVGDLISVMGDVALALVGVLVLEKNRLILNGRKNALYSMNKEERICFYILAAIVILGFKSLSYRGFVSAAAIIGIWAITVFSVSGGVSAGAVCGAVIGIILGADNDVAAGVAVFTTAGIVGGMTSEYGKVISAVTVSSAIAVGCFAVGSGTELVGFVDIPAAFVLAMLTKNSFIGKIGRICGLAKDNSDNERQREYIKRRLCAAACSFRTLAETFFELSDNRNTSDSEEVSMMFDRTADKVCRECSKMSECWVNNFNRTYKSLFHMLEVMEAKGELTEKDADENFSKKCLRLRAVVREMNRLFEIYKINRVWKSKLSENRELAGEQLGSVARILDDIAEELSEERVAEDSEEEIRIRLENKNFKIVSVSAVTDVKGRFKAYVETAADTSADDCRRAAETALKAVLGSRLVMNGLVRRKTGEMIFRFSQPEEYMIESGIASKSAKGENGDTCITRYLSEGKYAAALSDGMGTGHRASRDSGATVKLLGDFLEAGFDKTVAVRLINSIMVMKSADEAFATVDICVIDLFSGEAEFIKNGAEPGYLKRQSGVETIRAASLPVGVMQNVEVESFAYSLEENDVIVMISDGVKLKNGCEDWIKTTIEEADIKMPMQELADRIIDMAKALQGENTDDMTVAALKVCRR